MIRVNNLREIMRIKGFTEETLAKKMGISSKSLEKKLDNGILGSNEIDKIIEILHINNPNEIFFSK